MSKRIFVIGSLNADLVINTPKIPVIGETVMGTDFMIAPGGKGANQAVAAARLGGDVYMAGCVGCDIFGKDLVNNLIANNVNVENVKTIDGCSTGVAAITVKEGNNCIIVAPGANSRLSSEMVGGFEDIIKECSILVAQLEIPFETVKEAVRTAKKYNVKVLLNPAPAIKLEDEFLEDIDIITPNETECEIITGIPVKSVEDAKSAIAYLNGKGVKQVIITLGSKGAVYNSGSSIKHKPVPEVKVVDTTAAGDSFTSAIACALSEGMDIDSAIDFANIVGTLTVTKRGAQPSLPYLSDVKEFRADLFDEFKEVIRI